MYNFAFIDGQNLYLGTKSDNWKLDFRKFRIYLRDKYKINHAYYFIGYKSSTLEQVYKNIQDAGFLIIFKNHTKDHISNKKGNIDTDLVFEVMKTLIDTVSVSQIVLVSGDGDYKKMVDYLVHKKVFKKILFPNKRYASSLYNELGSEYFDFLSNIKGRIGYLK